MSMTHPMEACYQHQKHRAAELTDLVDCQVEVAFEPDTKNVDDPGSAGHLFHCFVNHIDENGGPRRDDDPTQLWLDDRQPESLEQQLASEIRREAARLVAIAEKLEADC